MFLICTEVSEACKRNERVRYGPAKWILLKLGSFDWSSLKSEAVGFQKSWSVPHPVKALFKDQRHLVQLLAIRILTANSTHSLLFTKYCCWQWAMNKLGNCFRWCSPHLKPRMLVFSVGNGPMNAPRYWQRRNERSELLTTGQWTLHDIGNRAMMPANIPRFCLGSSWAEAEKTTPTVTWSRYGAVGKYMFARGSDLCLLLTNRFQRQP